MKGLEMRTLNVRTVKFNCPSSSASVGLSTIMAKLQMKPTLYDAYCDYPEAHTTGSVSNLEQKRPFNTGKVVIGGAYVRTHREHLSADEILIQRALIGKRQRVQHPSDLVIYSLAVIALAVIFWVI